MKIKFHASNKRRVSHALRGGMAKAGTLGQGEEKKTSASASTNKY